MQKHHIDVAARVQLTATVAAERNQTYWHHFLPVALLGSAGGRGKNMAQHDIDERSAAGANFAAATARFVAQTQTMIFNPKKLLIERKEMGRVSPRRGGKLALGVLQNFILVTRHSLGETMEGIVQ
jgi:hypothetical protein